MDVERIARALNGQVFPRQVRRQPGVVEMVEIGGGQGDRGTLVIGADLKAVIRPPIKTLKDVFQPLQELRLGHRCLFRP